MIIKETFPFDIQEIKNLRISLSDGKLLTARAWIPLSAYEKAVPAILEYIPYRQHDGTVEVDALMHPYFAGHGYACLRVDIRGSGNSEGLLSDEYLKQEQDDVLEVLTWIEEQDWCSGNIGMIGISWGGFAALQAAARQPSQLKAIITCCSTDDRYTDDVHWMGGCLLNDSLSWGSGFLAGIVRPPDPDVVGENWKEIWRSRLELEEPPVSTWLKHQKKDEFWRHGSINTNYEKIKCAVYAVGGWTDGYTNAIFRMMQNLQSPRRALIGPWTHLYPHLGEPGDAIGFLQEALRWWDRWLKSTQNGIDDEPMITTWMQENFRANPSLPTVEGRWLHAVSWPSERQPIKNLFIGNNSLGEIKGSTASYEINSPMRCGFGGGEWCPKDSGADGPEYQFDQREDDGLSLCFDTHPLERPVEIFGAPCLELRLSSDKAAGLLAVRLCEVRPDGSSSRVSFAVLNLCHKDGSESPEPLLPNEEFRIVLKLNFVAYKFNVGNRIRVALSNNYWPMIWPSAENSVLSFHSKSFKLTLPLFESKLFRELEDPFERAECASPAKVTVIEKDSAERVLSYDVVSRKSSLIHTETSGPKRLDDINLVCKGAVSESFFINDDDPISAHSIFYRKNVVMRENWSATTITKLDFSCNKLNFFASISVEAFEADKKIFDRVWYEKIPRQNV